MRSSRPIGPAARRTRTPDLFLIMASDATFRGWCAELEADRKAQQAKAAVYHYYFTWRSPVREGKLRSYHTLEIPFVFDNVDASAAMTGKGQPQNVLADRMSKAWVAFARDGQSEPCRPAEVGRLRHHQARHDDLRQ